MSEPQFTPDCTAVCKTDRRALCYREQDCENKADSGACRKICAKIARDACSTPEAVEACRDGIWDKWWGNYGSPWCE